MKHTALTIGPIYKTMNRVKRTRAVWASSYFFSYFIRRIVEEVKNKGLKIILPNDEPIYKGRYGAGLYADRVYVEGSEKQALQTIVNEIIEEIAGDIAKYVNYQGAVVQYLKDYLNIHIIEVEYDENKKQGSKDNFLFEINRNLDLAELRQYSPFKDENSPLLDYLDSRLRKDTPLMQDAFGQNKEGRFLSIPEIATTDLKRKNQAEYDKIIDDLERKLKGDDPQYNEEHKDFDEDLNFMDLIVENNELNKLLRPYHKYYAVLYADGDGIGDLLKSVADDKAKLKGFSKQLFEFGINAAEIINNYGGKAIYIGGEDIFAFLPLACKKTDSEEMQNIFDLVKQLDEAFQKTIGNYAIENNSPSPTLSYGIMMGYIKHPLREAMEKAHELLDNNAKKVNGKNAIALRFEKHSGQYTTAVIEKRKTDSYRKILELVDNYTNTLSHKNEELLSSIIHRIKDDLFFELFIISARNGKLKHFISNSFNEDLHKTGPKAEFLKHFVELGNKLVNDYPNDKEVKDILFTVLRYIQFLNAKK